MSLSRSPYLDFDIFEVGMPTQDYAQGYDDPEADMILRSEDAQQFRVHSYHLKAASAYFRSLSLPSDLSRHHTPIVDIEGGGLRWLLDQITLARPPTIETWDTADTIAHLGQRYQFGRLPWIMAQNMQPCVEESPVQVFIFASQNDLEPLAKAAITQLGNDPDWHGLRIREFRQSWLGGAKAEYVVALIVAMRSTEGKHEAVDWKKVAEMFKIER